MERSSLCRPGSCSHRAMRHRPASPCAPLGWRTCAGRNARSTPSAAAAGCMCRTCLATPTSTRPNAILSRQATRSGGSWIWRDLRSEKPRRPLERGFREWPRTDPITAACNTCVTVECVDCSSVHHCDDVIDRSPVADEREAGAPHNLGLGHGNCQGIRCRSRALSQELGGELVVLVRECFVLPVRLEHLCGPGRSLAILICWDASFGAASFD